jgi:hypothetical protein
MDLEVINVAAHPAREFTGETPVPLSKEPDREVGLFFCVKKY